jgi:hypothetical protein
VTACNFQLIFIVLSVAQFKRQFMKSTGVALFTIILAGVLIFGSSCSRKSGCPAGAVGAEKLLSGDKVPKQKKFRS